MYFFNFYVVWRFCLNLWRLQIIICFIIIFTNPDKVNDVNFEDMCNSEAVDFLRKVVQEPGPLTLTIAKCWDPSPPPMNHHYPPHETNGTGPGRFNEPIRPIDPAQESFGS